MQRKLKITEDGSPTFFVPALKEHYHSVFGAMGESDHVFIQNAFRRCEKSELSVFEVGFGSGLNALLTCREAENSKRNVMFHTIELYPLEDSEWLEFGKHLAAGGQDSIFNMLHECSWGEEISITRRFRIRKIAEDFHRYEPDRNYDVIYFDAFGPEVQPDMWTAGVFEKISTMMNNGAILSTYSARGYIRRNMQEAGLKVERIPGPRGKRHMTIAFKPIV